MDGTATTRRRGTIASYIASFSGGLQWDDIVRWPADAFALSNLVLDYTEAYRFAVSPAPGHRWPPHADWQHDVVTAAKAWHDSTARPADDVPRAVSRQWQVVVDNLQSPLDDLRAGRNPDLSDALLTLHAMADEAHRPLATVGGDAGRVFGRAARDLLATQGSLSHLDPTRVRVVPKTQLVARGLTIRSFSRYLALDYEAVDLYWRHVEVGPGNWVEGRSFHQVLVPWPLKLDAGAFRPAGSPLEMDREFGFFSFEPAQRLDLVHLRRLITEAQRRAPRVDSVIFPESAIHADEVAAVETLLAELGVHALVAGVREPPVGGRLARNYAHLGFHTDAGWQHFQQDKHHRWCLDPPQIRQYHLARALEPTRQWWEAIELPPRTVQIIDTGGGATLAPLICEDLARLDEVADTLRRIGPSFVIALLLDGPQLSQRWACRYASILADDPGCAVLTLSSLGMVARSRSRGVPASRTVGMWSDPVTGIHAIDLPRGASGVLITSTVRATTAWTADGRRHEQGMPYSVLSAVDPLRVPVRTPQPA